MNCPNLWLQDQWTQRSSPAFQRPPKSPKCALAVYKPGLFSPSAAPYSSATSSISQATAMLGGAAPQSSVTSRPVRGQRPISPSPYPCGHLAAGNQQARRRHEGNGGREHNIGQEFDLSTVAAFSQYNLSGSGGSPAGDRKSLGTGLRCAMVDQAGIPGQSCALPGYGSQAVGASISIWALCRRPL
jgi:hypothetical protein